MELRATREMRRNEQLAKVMGKRAQTSDAPAKEAQAPQPKEPSDKFSLSRQALAYVEEQRRAVWNGDQEREQDRTGGLLDALETKKSELDSMSEKLKTLNKCQKIAAAIMRGDRVPPEDLRYLMEHDKEGYKMALALRRPKKDPEDVKSVLDEEDRNGNQTEGTDGGGEVPDLEAAVPSESGGNTPDTAE